MDPAHDPTQLVFRVLSEPNPECHGERHWRMPEVAARATLLRGATFTREAAGAALHKALVPQGLARAFADSGRHCTLWCLTDEARLPVPRDASRKPVR